MERPARALGLAFGIERVGDRPCLGIDLEHRPERRTGAVDLLDPLEVEIDDLPRRIPPDCIHCCSCSTVTSSSTNAAGACAIAAAERIGRVTATDNTDNTDVTNDNEGQTERRPSCRH